MAMETDIFAQTALTAPLNERLPVQPDHVYEARLAAVGGASAILEMIGRGRLPVEIALANEINLLFFDDWLRTKVDTSDLTNAMRIGAEALQLKAQTCLSMADAGADGVKLRAQAAHYQTMAERLDPAKWAVQRAADAQTLGVTLNLNFGGDASANQTIEGTLVGEEPAQETAVDLFKQLTQGPQT